MKAISLLLVLISLSCSHQKISKDPIRDVFIGKIEKYRQCYHESESYTGKRHDKKTGQMKVWLEVSADGSVQGTKILESDFKDPNLDACVQSILRSLKFDPSVDGKTFEVTQPLRFDPGQT